MSELFSRPERHFFCHADNFLASSFPFPATHTGCLISSQACRTRTTASALFRHMSCFWYGRHRVGSEDSTHPTARGMTAPCSRAEILRTKNQIPKRPRRLVLRIWLLVLPLWSRWLRLIARKIPNPKNQEPRTKSQTPPLILVI